jgi:hypothetical protein
MRSTQRGGAAERGDNCIRVIVGEDFAEVRARFGHRLSPGLAEADAMSPADSSEYSLPAFFFHDEVIARHGAPAQAAAEAEARRLVGGAEGCSILSRESALPA